MYRQIVLLLFAWGLWGSLSAQNDSIWREANIFDTEEFIPGLTPQETFSPEWAFGINAGATLSRIRFNPNIPQEYLMQYSGGISVRYISEKHFGIVGEVNYSMRGWKERTDEFYLNTYSRRISYLEVPILTHLYFDMGRRVRFVFNVGPQIGILLSEKVLEKEIPAGSEGKVYYDRDAQKKFDYGIKGTLGFELRTGIGSFVLDGRYYFGLSDIFASKSSDTFGASSNQVIGINLTYFFKLNAGK